MGETDSTEMKAEGELFFREGKNRAEMKETDVSLSLSLWLFFLRSLLDHSRPLRFTDGSLNFQTNASAKAAGPPTGERRPRHSGLAAARGGPDDAGSRRKRGEESEQ